MGEVRSIEFTIQSLPKMTNAQMVHWRFKHLESKKWRRLVYEEVVKCPRPNEPFLKAALVLHRHSTKEPDFDGLVSGFKHVIDGLVGAGVLIGDKPSIIGQPQYFWVYARPRHGFIRVQVIDQTQAECEKQL